MHEWGTESTVKTDTERLCVHHGDIECLCILSRESSSCSINDGARDKEWERSQVGSFLEELKVGVDACASIEGIKDGLNEDDVRAALNQAVYLLLVRILNLYIVSVSV